MTPVEILTNRWDRLQEARLREVNDLTKNAAPGGQVVMVDYLNRDPFWEGLFDQLETQLRFHDPAHSYLPENQIPV